MATNPVTPVPPVFPMEVELKLKFLVKNQDDYDFLTVIDNTDSGIVTDMLCTATELNVDLIQINDLKLI